MNFGRKERLNLVTATAVLAGALAPNAAEAQSMYTWNDILVQREETCREIADAGLEAQREESEAYRNHREDGDTIGLALDRNNIRTEYERRVNDAEFPLRSMFATRLFIIGSRAQAWNDMNLGSCATYVPPTVVPLPNESPNILPPIGRK